MEWKWWRVYWNGCHWLKTTAIIWRAKCLTRNSKITTNFVTLRWTFNVKETTSSFVNLFVKLIEFKTDSPTVELRLGNKGKDASQIMEGSDLALSCDVRSSKPEVRSFDWYWNDQLISKNQLGVVMNRGSLVLHRVEKSQSGSYYCAARNVHGVGRSRSLTIKISCKFYFL